MKLSILIPVYNEKDTLGRIINSLKPLPVEKELIIVDDCSTDGSREILNSQYKNQPGVSIIFHKENMGKGAAVKTALKEATGDYAIIQDADLEYNPQDQLLLLDTAEKEKVSVVYGSRFLKTWRVTSFCHFLVNSFLTAVTNILFRCHLTDMETCYKLINIEVFRGLDIESDGFEIEAEITAKLLKKGYDIIEVPISYKGRNYHEGKKITWKDGFITLGALFKYRFLSLNCLQ